VSLREPEPDVAPSNGESIDIERVLLARLDGDRELLREAIGIFLDTCPPLVDTLRKALESSNFAAAARAAHSIKGSAGNFDTGTVTMLAQLVENHARKRNLPAAKELLLTLDKEVAALLAELAAITKDR
jgi:HPt (histidine-containing phosphotransfer) domain-containing protein